MLTFFHGQRPVKIVVKWQWVHCLDHTCGNSQTFAFSQNEKYTLNIFVLQAHFFNLMGVSTFVYPCLWQPFYALEIVVQLGMVLLESIDKSGKTFMLRGPQNEELSLTEKLWCMQFNFQHKTRENVNKRLWLIATDWRNALPSDWWLMYLESQLNLQLVINLID